MKVLRPGIEHRVATDIDLFEPLLELVARRPASTRPVSWSQMFEGFRAQLGEELDLRNEARADGALPRAARIVDLPLVTVPEVFPELLGPRVLTMEFLDGVPVDDLAAIAPYGYDPAPRRRSEVIKGFLLTTIRWGTSTATSTPATCCSCPTAASASSTGASSAGSTPRRTGSSGA